MPALKRRLKNLSKAALHTLFVHGQRLGVDILPRHFYSEIPVVHDLRSTDHWRTPYSLFGVDGLDLPAQVDFLDSCCPEEVRRHLARERIFERACGMNGEPGFGEIEAELLFAFVATKKPRHIFQIGAGVSTAVCLLAADYADYRPHVTCVDPQPTRYLVGQHRQGTIDLARLKAQDLSLDEIARLDDDLLFFIDSSHTLGPAGECSRIILEMLPRLKPGAWVHFHDIFFPYDYPRDALTTLFFTHESVLLHAFLAYNSRFRLAASLSMLHYHGRRQLAARFPRYVPAADDHGLARSDGHFPSSAYLRAMVQHAGSATFAS